MGTQGTVRIGISGWRYKGWRGVFYPPKLPQRRELEFAAQSFRSVEINGTFYSLQRPSSFRAWAASTPDDFVFSVKGPRLITHMYKLRNIDQALANFFASGLLELRSESGSTLESSSEYELGFKSGSKLGPVLWQFAPQMRFDPARFADFFALLPRTLGAVASLARLHGPRLTGPASTTLDAQVSPTTQVRHCVEIRHPSFEDPKFVELLRAHDIGLVVADTVAWPLLFDVTSDFVYCRLHGSEELYASGYKHDALEVWADRVAAWATGERASGRRVCDREAERRPRDVYVYFDNDVKVRAPFDAQVLEAKVRERIG